ncbi:Sn1-specific diacylglycerol lipase beta [Galdieria sulphuraria]|nr:Sn1-specific diacylglycerol lipase beta [Galdieria sulphuraria]
MANEDMETSTPQTVVLRKNDNVQEQQQEETVSNQEISLNDDDDEEEELLALYEKRLRRFCCLCCFQCDLFWKENEQKEETKQAISHFSSLIVGNGFQDLLPDDWILGVKVYKRIQGSSHRQTQPSEPIQNKPLETLEQAKRFMQHAEAVFGPLLFAIEKPSQAILGITPQLVIFLRTGVHSKDIVAHKFKADTYFPAYYICYDHLTLSIVVAVRGTLSIADALTDLDGLNEPLKITFAQNTIHGFVHNGMLRAAQRLTQTMEPILRNACESYPSYRLIVTGHSLGAGCAMVLSILLRERNICDNLQCYAFGPPPVLSDTLAEACHSFVISFVHNNDIVPRLSIPALRRFFRACQIAKRYNSFQRLALWLGWTNWIHLDVSTLEHSSDETYESQRLFVGGTIYHLQKIRTTNRYFQCHHNRPIYSMSTIMKQQLREIIGLKVIQSIDDP